MPHSQGSVAEIAHQQALAACAVPEEFQPMHVNLFAAQRDLTVDQQIRIAQIGAEYGVVVLRHRAEQQRPRLFQEQFEVRQNARIAVIQPFGISRLAADIAAMIEHGEGVAVLQRASAALLERCAGRDVMLGHGRFVRRQRRCLVGRGGRGS
jgi:hypothetical protein